MPILLDPPAPSKSSAIPSAWQVSMQKLAAWAMDRTVNRTDAYGLNHADGSRTTAHAPLTAGRLASHFYGLEILGVHLISLKNTCKFIAVDIDAHGDGDDVDQVAKRNLATALELARRAFALGFHPLLMDSNGRGGLHLEIFFSSPIPSADAYHFAMWLCRDFDANKAGGIEFFPKRANRNTEKGFGGAWLRLPGKHHKRGHWTRVFDFARAGVGLAPWLAGQAAIDTILEHNGDDPALLDAVRPDFTPAAPPATPATPPARPTVPLSPRGPRPTNPLDRCWAYVQRMPDAISGRGGHNATFSAACKCFEFGLLDFEAQEVMKKFNANKTGGEPWTEAEILHKLAGAKRAVEAAGIFGRRLENARRLPGGCHEVANGGVCANF